MTNDSEQKRFETEIEEQRVSIADLRERVKNFVKRREDTSLVAKSDAIGELQRKIDTIKEDRVKTGAAAAST
jgi:ribosome recycling factor